MRTRISISSIRWMCVRIRLHSHIYACVAHIWSKFNVCVCIDFAGNAATTHTHSYVLYMCMWNRKICAVSMCRYADWINASMRVGIFPTRTHTCTKINHTNVLNNRSKFCHTHTQRQFVSCICNRSQFFRIVLVVFFWLDHRRPTTATFGWCF